MEARDAEGEAEAEIELGRTAGAERAEEPSAGAEGDPPAPVAAAVGTEPHRLSARAQKLKDELLGEFSLTVDDVAGVLEVDRSTIYRYIQDGSLVALKLGREYRLSERDVRAFLEGLIVRERERVAGLRGPQGEPEPERGPKGRKGPKHHGHHGPHGLHGTKGHGPAAGEV